MASRFFKWKNVGLWSATAGLTTYFMAYFPINNTSFGFPAEKKVIPKDSTWKQRWRSYFFQRVNAESNVDQIPIKEDLPQIIQDGEKEDKNLLEEKRNLAIKNRLPPHYEMVGIPTPTSELKIRQGYVVCFDRRTRNPIWAFEHLTKNRVRAEDVTREKSMFQEDESIPSLFRAKLADYESSGYDRGHLVPAADVKMSQKAMDETFYLSNISPQVGVGFNRDYWSRLEHFIRSLTSFYQDVFVVTGPLFLHYKDSDGKYYVKYEIIGNPPNVAVPTHFFKVILGISDKDDTYVVGSFVVPNQPIPENTPIESFLRPLELVQRSSGLLFFPNFFKNADPKKIHPLCVKTVCQLPPPNFYQKYKKELKQ